MSKGIDVSHNNGTIDWGLVKATGKVDFAILRTGYGVKSPKQIDREFERNYAECKRLKIPVGAYHYSYADSVDRAIEEAEFCLELIGGKQFEYPIFLDIEEKVHNKMSKEDNTEIVKAFCGELEKSGYWAGVYSFDSFFSDKLDTSIPKRYAAWVARVPSSGNAIITPKNSENMGIHQYSWKGTINGIKGDVDLDECYRDYPTAIKKAGKNGYKQMAQSDNLYTVFAEMHGLTKAKADKLCDICKSEGMSVDINKE